MKKKIVNKGKFTRFVAIMAATSFMTGYAAFQAVAADGNAVPQEPIAPETAPAPEVPAHTPIVEVPQAAIVEASYTEEELDMLARIIYLEARGEFDEYGMQSLLAVGTVIMNRFDPETEFYGRYGEDMFEVISKRRQFSSYNRKTFLEFEPKEEGLWQICRYAASRTLDGERVLPVDYTIFFNREISTDVEFVDKYHDTIAIGHHEFSMDK